MDVKVINFYEQGKYLEETGQKLNSWIFKHKDFFNYLQFPREPGRYKVIVHPDIFIKLEEFYKYDEYERRGGIHPYHQLYKDNWKFFRKDKYLQHYIYPKNENVSLNICEDPTRWETEILIEIKEEENTKPEYEIINEDDGSITYKLIKKTI